MMIGQKIKFFRKEKGLTQDQFASKLGVHYQSVSRWERDLSVPDIAQFDAIAKTLDVRIEDLLDLPNENSVVGENFSSSKMGEALKILRTSNGLSQTAFAKLFDSTSDSVSKWERGLISPSIDTLTEIAKHFNVSISAIYYGSFNASETYKKEAKVKNVSAATKSKKNIKSKILAVLCVILTVTLATILVFSLINLPTNPTGGSSQTPQTPPAVKPSEVSFLSPIEQGILVHKHDKMCHNITTNSYYPHNGVCILADEGTNVVASFSGTVYEINTEDLYLGPYIVVKGKDLKAIYHFVNAVDGLEVGDNVTIGQTIATVNTVGGENYQIGTHIRFEIIEDGSSVDPENYITFTQNTTAPIEGSIEHHYGDIYYNATLGNYETDHQGICVLADEGTNVFASFSGTVTEFNNDVILGPYIVVERRNLKAIYHFVNAVDGLEVGDNVTIGQTIATVCGAVGENYKLGSHIRFELFVDDYAVNPEDYITFAG